MTGGNFSILRKFSSQFISKVNKQSRSIQATTQARKKLLLARARKFTLITVFICTGRNDTFVSLSVTQRDWLDCHNLLYKLFVYKQFVHLRNKQFSDKTFQEDVRKYFSYIIYVSAWVIMIMKCASASCDLSRLSVCTSCEHLQILICSSIHCESFLKLTLTVCVPAVVHWQGKMHFFWYVH